MVGRSTRTAVALAIGVAILGFMGWLDGSVMRNGLHESLRFFRVFSLQLSFGYLAVAGAVFVVGLVARWAQSLWVGISYALAGAAFTFLRAIYTGPAAWHADNPPLLPDPLVQAVARVSDWSTGPLNATEIIGAAMLLAGVLTIGLEVRHRQHDRSAQQIPGVGLAEESARL